MVRLLIEGAAVNKLLFSVMALVPPKINEERVLTSILPDVLLIVPLIPSVVAPIVRFPLVSVSVLFTFSFVERITP